MWTYLFEHLVACVRLSGYLLGIFAELAAPDAKIYGIDYISGLVDLSERNLNRQVSSIVLLLLIPPLIHTMRLTLVFILITHAEPQLPAFASRGAVRCQRMAGAS